MGAMAFWNRGVPTENTKIEKPPKSQKSQYLLLHPPPLRNPGNLGEKRFTGTTDEGVSRRIRAQVCSVNRALLSVRKVVNAGNKVVFDGAGSYSEDNATGERMYSHEKHGVYMLKMWTKSANREGF